MSTRDHADRLKAVEEEFTEDFCGMEVISGTRLIEEVVRLRNELEGAQNVASISLEAMRQMQSRLAAVEADRDAEKQRRREIDNEAFEYAEQVEVMRRRVGRAERILAALREPNKNIVRAADREWNGNYCNLFLAIRAAVEAAEKEVES